MWNVDIDWLRCFLICAEYKSFSKVAERLHMTQPAVSKQIRKLEDELGVELLHRSPQGIQLTEAGIQFQKRTTSLLEDWEIIKKDMNKFGERVDITLGLLPSLAAFYLPQKLVNYKDENVKINTNVYDMSKEIMEDLLSGKIDAGLVDEKWVPKNYWNKELFKESYDVVFQKEHSFHQQDIVFMNQLLLERLVMYPAGCDIRRAIIEEYEKWKVKPNISTEVSFRDFILGMVASGAGVTIVPRTISEHIGHLPLLAKPICDFKKQRVIYVIARTEKIGKTLFKMFGETV
ncbi:TPA: LysR family transcriptional regulator [Bacillus cereus]